MLCARVRAKQLLLAFPNCRLGQNWQKKACVEESSGREPGNKGIEPQASSLVRALMCFLPGSSPKLPSGNLPFVSSTSPAS